MTALLRAPVSYGHCLWSRMPAGYSGKPPCLPERKGEGDLRAFPRVEGPILCPARGASRAACPRGPLSSPPSASRRSAPSLGAARKEPWGGEEHEEETDPGRGRRSGAAAGVAAPALARVDARGADAAVHYGWLLELRAPTKTQSSPSTASRRGRRARASRRPSSTTTRRPTTRPTTCGTPASPCGASSASSTTRTRRRSTRSSPPPAPATTSWSRRVDGFAATYTSAEVATLGDKLVVADRVNGQPLTLGTASIKNDVAGWKPNWPLKLVSSDTSIFGSRKPAGIARISIAPATTAPTPPSATAGCRSCARPPRRSPSPSTASRRGRRASGRARDRRRRQQDPRRRHRRPARTRASPCGASSAASTTTTRRRSTRSSPPPGPATTSWSRASTASPRRTPAPRSRRSADKLVVADRVNAQPLHAGHRLHQERRRRLEAQLAAQAGLERHQHLRQPQAGRDRPHQHRAGDRGEHAPF